MTRRPRYSLRTLSVFMPLLALSCCGCPFLVEGPEISAGAAIHGSTPGGLPSLDDGVAARAAVGWDGLISTGVSVHAFEGAAPIFSFEADMDLGAMIADEILLNLGRNWLSLRPVVGVWVWDDSPEDAGLLAGVRIGLAHATDESALAHIIRIEYQRIWLCDVAGDDDAELDALTLSVTW